MVRVTVKWNKATFDNVELDPSQPVSAFLETLRQLTNVPPSRQKLMAKGLWAGFLKEDANFAGMPITEGFVFTLMGTADVIVEPAKTTTFVEDMTETEKAKAGAAMPPGLYNLGNTCYLNSVVQCMRMMPELRSHLNHINGPAQGVLAFQAKMLFQTMDSRTGSFPPVGFVEALRQNFPMFDEKQNGHHMQQDAEEFFNVLVQSLSGSSNDHEGVLAIETEQKMTCLEAPQEPVVPRKQIVNKLICSIQGSTAGSAPVDYLHEGLKLFLHGTIEKNSPILGRNALWQISTSISKLPKYICVQFMRFFWKETPESTEHQGIKCKILRMVTFPDVMNVFDMCTEELQNVLRQNRIRESDAIDSKSASTSSDAMDTSSSSVFDSAAWAASNSHLFAAGVPSTTTGNYELHSVVTHKGRSADSGHYISFASKAPKSNEWWKFDDQNVTETNTDDIMKLKGGGDRDMAYLLFYRIRE